MREELKQGHCTNRVVHFQTVVIFLLFSIIIGAAPVWGKDKPRRTIKVKLVGDQYYAKLTVWERKAARQLIDIAEEVNGLLQVNIEITGYELWQHEPESDLYKLTARMINEVEPDGAEVLIGFTHGPCPDKKIKNHTDGVTIPYRGMMIRTYYPRCQRNAYIPYVMIHEMVHLLGGLHVRDGSLMSPVFADTINLVLDQLNQRIVRLTQDIDFREGYASLDRQTLEKLAARYREAVTAGNHEAETLNELGSMYLTLGKLDEAEKEFNRALAPDSSFTGVWLNLAECRRMKISPQEAIATLQTALEAADDRGVVYARLARLYFDLDDRENSCRNAVEAQKRGATVDSVLLTPSGDIPDSKP